jgi:hypothetical protein
MKNRELFVNDPLSFTIPNDGVTIISNPKSPNEWEIVKYELRSFVCEGEYRKGLERILSTFLANLDQPKQPAVWVNGFYGSGKSHLVRVLEYLWRDVEFPDGARARSLVTLPTEIQDMLKELTTAGKRQGGLWSAAGTLSASAFGSVRLALLAIDFRSAGLPEDYAQACFVIWLHHNGYFQKVNDYIESKGFTLADELQNLYVSPHITDGLLAAYPDFANNAKDARNLIRTQFARKEDISDDELISTLEDVLELQEVTPGRLPLTLLILDEVQQFLGDDQQRTLHLQEAVQACSNQLGSRLLFVGTGQASLQENPQLSKLVARFTVKVTLEDSDVERVVRQVVLRKNPAAGPQLKATLEKVSGEIDRHLAGSRIGPMADDKAVLISDYPLLPTRRRFWERALRAIDPGGTQGQLRTQLRVVHEANRLVADRPVGTVVPADVIYDQQSSSMLQSAVLDREMATMIQQMEDGTEDGRLLARLCKLIFLIGKLPTQGPLATGLKASADTLADLLVEDLQAGSAGLREKIPGLLQRLVDKGMLLRIKEDFQVEEYRLQTLESADWEADFRKRLQFIRADETRIASERATLLKNAVTAALKAISLTQGNSKTPRKYHLYFGLDEPRTEDSEIPIWVQDEWSTSEGSVRSSSQQAGTESPIVYTFLPKRDADSLKEAIVSYHAAKDTLDTRSNPTTAAGFDARQGMDFRKTTGQQRVDQLVALTLEKAKIFQGGGNEIVESGLVDAVRTALEASLVRMFGKFDLADNANWGKVVEKARDGAADALRYVDYHGDPDKHPVCREALDFVGPSRKGSEIRKHFMGSGYGWPQDAVDGALFALLAGGFIAAIQNGKSIGIKELDKTQVNSSEFRGMTVVITATQRILLRGLLTDLQIPFKTGEEGTAIPVLLERLTNLASQAGGMPPLPECPTTLKLGELNGLVGNEQYAAVVEARDELKNLSKAWSMAHSKKDERLPRWQTLQQLQHHAAGLRIAEEIGPDIQAILNNRSLLDDPDPLQPLLNRLVDGLRQAIQKAHKTYHDSFQLDMVGLEKLPAWQTLTNEQRQGVLFQAGLATQASAPKVSMAEELLNSLNAASLETWKSRTAALTSQYEQVRLLANQLLEPQAVQVRLPSATIKNETELEAYLEKVRQEVKKNLKDGHPVIL